MAGNAHHDQERHADRSPRIQGCLAVLLLAVWPGPSALAGPPAVTRPSTPASPDAPSRSGRVLHGGNGRPVAGALVSDGSHKVRTDPWGRYRLPGGTGRLTVLREGFMPLGVVPGPGEQEIRLQPSGEWPMLRMERGRTGFTPLVGHFSTVPGVAWRYPLGSSFSWKQRAFFADLDGDGSGELLLLIQGRLVARDSEGDLLWDSRAVSTPEAPAVEIDDVVAIADLDRDGKSELVCVTGGGHFKYQHSTLMVLDAQSGRVRWVHRGFDFMWTAGRGEQAPRNDGYGLNFANVRVVDLDGDRAPEVVARAAFNDHLLAFDFSAGASRPKVRWDVLFPGFDNDSYALIAADLDGDGRPELIQHDGATLYVFRGIDGTLLTSRSFLTGRQRAPGGTLLAADVDGDGRPELVLLQRTLGVRVFALQGRDLVLRWKKELSNSSRPGRALADLDGDGALELVVEENGTTLVLAATSGAEQQVLQGKKARIVRDVDGDGRPELITESKEGLEAYRIAPAGPERLWNIGGSFFPFCPYKWSPSFRPEVFEANFDSYYDHDCHLADIDDDGADELLVQRGAAGLAAYDLNPGGPEQRWHYDFGRAGKLSLVGAGRLGRQPRILVATLDGTYRLLDGHGQTLATYPAGHHAYAPLVANLDGQGAAEVVLRSADSKMLVLDTAGAGPRRPPRPAAGAFAGYFMENNLTVYHSPILADLDGDAVPEILMRTGAGELGVHRRDGTVLWSTPRPVEYFTLGHFDGDLLWDVAVAEAKSGRLAALRGRDGTELNGFANRRSVNPLATFDPTGRGTDDLLIKDNVRTVYRVDLLSGRELWNNTRQGMCALGLTLSGPLELPPAAPPAGGTPPEPGVVVTGGASFTAWTAGGQPLWSVGYESETAKTRHAAAADLDGDGDLELVYPTAQGTLDAYDPENAGSDYRNPLWTFRLPGQVTFSDPVAADLDGDGQVEFLAGANDGFLYALHGRDGRLLWKVDLQSPVHHPIVADIDGDRDAEILVCAGGNLLALDTDQPPDLTLREEDLSWPAQVKADQPFLLQVGIRNLGGRAASGVTVRFYKGKGGGPAEELLGSTPLNVPPGGEPVPASLRTELPRGRWSITVKVDGSAAGEQNPDDNEATRRLTVR